MGEAVMDSRRRSSIRAGYMPALAAFVAVLGLVMVGLLALTASARAGDVPPPEDTVWLCKPGIDDNPCLDEDLGGTGSLASGGSPTLDYRPAGRTGFDCFYVYPTQSEQPRLNADYSRDLELKAVAANQAAQFSRICDVYAPVYRQYTNQALGALGSLGPEGVAEIRDIAYDTMRDGFADFISNHSKGRGFVLIGHSQGASHLSRLIDEEIDPNPALRKRMISAIVPGSNNIYVPKGEVVGGNLENIPACTRGDQLGCVMAWSIYLEKAETGLPANANFGRLGAGYWVYPEDRPDPEQFEVLCVNPAELSGAQGQNTVLANLPALTKNLGVPDPWNEFRGFYRTECLKGEDSSWLDMSAAPDVTPPFLDGLLRSPQINSTLGGLHLGDVNLVLGDLITIASRQGARYISWRKAVSRSADASRNLGRARTAARKAAAQARKASWACIRSVSKPVCGKAAGAVLRERRAARKVGKLTVVAKKAKAAADRAYG